MTDMIGAGRVDVARGLLHVDVFFDLPIQKGSHYIHLYTLHVPACYESQKHAKGLSADDWGKMSR
jgi:hypothetical protein